MIDSQKAYVRQLVEAALDAASAHEEAVRAAEFTAQMVEATRKSAFDKAVALRGAIRDMRVMYRGMIVGSTHDGVLLRDKVADVESLDLPGEVVPVVELPSHPADEIPSPSPLPFTALQADAHAKMDAVLAADIAASQSLAEMAPEVSPPPAKGKPKKAKEVAGG